MFAYHLVTEGYKEIGRLPILSLNIFETEFKKYYHNHVFFSTKNVHFDIEGSKLNKYVVV
jgi:hypothetical protein